MRLWSKLTVRHHLTDQADFVWVSDRFSSYMLDQTRPLNKKGVLIIYYNTFLSCWFRNIITWPSLLRHRWDNITECCLNIRWKLHIEVRDSIFGECLFTVNQRFTERFPNVCSKICTTGFRRWAKRHTTLGADTYT